MAWGLLHKKTSKDRPSEDLFGSNIIVKMLYSVASSVIAIVLLASRIEAVTPYNSGAGNIYKLPVTQVYTTSNSPY